MVVTNCSANGVGIGFGGGIYTFGGTVMTVTSSTISSNVASAEGGGIYSDQGSVTLTDVTISGNSSGNGGGIASRSGGSLVLVRCTVSNNQATFGGAARYGGGIYADGGTLTSTNSTISGNQAVNGGGGIIDGNVLAMIITDCTITGNTTTFGGGGIDLGTTAADIRNSILAGNTGAGGNNFYNRGSGSLVSGGYNLADDAPAGLTGPGDLTNANAALDPLADNGGPTHTHALQASSDAVDHIPVGTNGCQAGVSIDQRSAPRAGGSGFGGSACDVGAFEYQPIPVELMRFTID
jgi:hypothetical protein